MELELDHLVVAAATLQDGVDHVCALVGCSPDQFAPEGKHAAFGTHNRCLGMEDGIYLEVIAVDPEVPPPPRPRWFGLDDPSMQARLREQGPQLLHFVARLKPASNASLKQLAAERPDLVPPVTDLQRGDYSWSICVPADGSLPWSGPEKNGSAAGGLVPSLIQWHSAATPAQRLPSSGLKLLRLTGRHRQAEAINQALAALGADKLIRVEAAPSAALPSLHAAIWNTTNLRGTRTLF